MEPIGEISPQLREKIALLPKNPGVYKMFDSRGKVIYVGKAKNLKNRVRQYFQSHTLNNRNDVKVRAMVAHIADFEYIITKNEAEALTLESNLIKQFKPHYNILLKDDKHFPYIRVDRRRDYPRFEIVRRIKNDGAKYFGPYLSALALREAFEAIRDYFPVRHCKKDIAKAQARRERPCLMYHINKCCAPCSGNVTPQEYSRLLDSVCDFLDGDVEKITGTLRDEMNSAAEEMDFERAAVLRDRIRALEMLGEKQRASASKVGVMDVFAASSDETGAVVFALFVREGKVIGTNRYFLEGEAFDDAELIGSFLKQYYNDSADIPSEILLQHEPDDAESIEEWLRLTSAHAVHLRYPMRGDKKALVDMAAHNAAAELEKRNELKKREWERGEGALMELSLKIGMDFVPERIECYDNSHIQGTDTVGAMIVFTDGKPDKNQYRRFKIRSNTQGDDYLAMEEVLRRRFERAKQGDEKFSRLPDLIIADGGRGQLNVVLRVLEEYGLDYIMAIGLAERNEEIILKDSDEPLKLDSHSASEHLIERIRDEAHRFAITYHRSLRSKSALYSVLDSIEGVGEKRKRALFDRFLTIDAIAEASVEDIAAVPGMNRTVAEKVHALFEERRNNNEE